MPNNFIQRPRLFNPAQSYQQGRGNRIRDDVNRQTQQVNAFNLQQNQQMAPIRNQAELVKLQADKQSYGAATRKETLAKAQQLRKGAMAFGSQPLPVQMREYQTFYNRVSDFAGDNEMPTPEEFAADPAVYGAWMQRFDNQLGAYEKQYGAPVAGVDASGNPQMRQFDKTGGNRVVPGFGPQPRSPLVQVGPSGQAPTIPPALLSGLSAPVSERASAAYTAAGGGKDGLTAANKEMSKGTTQERRASSVNILRTAFPKASSAELQQMQGTMDAAKDNEAGLKSATAVREEQRRLKKAKVFQERALILVDKILSNPELNDVLGSVEGSDAGYLYGEKFRSDLEAEAIADIEEAQNILTADNLKLMSGVLSETDIKILTNLAGGALNRKRGEIRFRSDVSKLRDKLSSQSVQTVDDRQNAPPPTIQELKSRLDAFEKQHGR